MVLIRASLKGLGKNLREYDHRIIQMSSLQMQRHPIYTIFISTYYKID